MQKEERMTEEKKSQGRPPKPIEHIPDTFENVIKALVQPPKKDEEG